MEIFAHSAEEFTKPNKKKTPGEKIAGRIDPELMELKQRFEREYWELIQKKLKENNIGVEALTVKRDDTISANADRCITTCVQCVTACNSDCIASTAI